MQKKQKEAVHRKYFDSPIGRICIEDDGEALTGLYLQKEGKKSGCEPARAKDSECADKGVREEAPRKNPESSELLEEAERQLRAYFAGERTAFDLPLHLHGTEFQMKVWNALRQIPYGETRTYAELAAMVGNPKACRAVGGANNKNPIMIFVPCHRIIGADGSLVGYGGGLDAKRFLLELEAEVAGECAAEDTPGRCAVVEDTAVEENTGIGENAPVYAAKHQGEYTLEDYYALPEERRVELIDGVIYDMGAPTFSHQSVAGLIYRDLMNYVDANKGRCIPAISPVDVQLDRDDKTMVQPDVLIVCDRDKVINRCVYGAPDLVVEVLSDSSLRRDTVIKLQKYKNAGVREYWIIDQKNEKILVYDFENGNVVQIYGMNSKVPVRIFEGKCEIDFGRIYERLRDWRML